MQKQRVFLLLNGDFPKSIPNLAVYHIICATDGAYQHLKKHHITPDFISGDFDSIEEIPKNIEVITTPNQEYTDFDKILKILYKKGYTNVDVFGASGKEQDHFLGNLNTAITWKKKLKLTFFDDYGFYFLADNVTKFTGCIHKTVSLIPFPKAKNITTKGLQYALKGEDLKLGKRIGTRNKAIENNIEITFTKGNLFIFINK
ncbi:thiamine diphosphokinase [uncultured Polaribacter sp.]|uniref:thiamine diphosphokinase n=1 Tax=uncultured Polaribacter sp. TaxID=174711 RepID=UPI002634D08B|nr:thiamine diphosphokinase [uncultured Polaribacter sp.]